MLKERYSRMLKSCIKLWLILIPLATISLAGSTAAFPTAQAAVSNEAHHQHEEGWPPEWAVKWLGFGTGACLLATISLGILFRRFHWKVFRYHRVVAIVTVGLGLCHGLLALAHRLGGVS